ncbi:MAG TPA: hypothetical protein VEU11_02400 [Terriglobales bacterium]|nr:hypothetical protein [Terriglobales bacterium]
MQIEVGPAVKLPELYKNLEFDDPNDEQTKAQIAIFGHFSQQADLSQGHGKVWLITAVDSASSNAAD